MQIAERSSSAAGAWARACFITWPPSADRHRAPGGRQPRRRVHVQGGGRYSAPARRRGQHPAGPAVTRRVRAVRGTDRDADRLQAGRVPLCPRQRRRPRGLQPSRDDPARSRHPDRGPRRRRGPRPRAATQRGRRRRRDVLPMGGLRDPRGGGRRDTPPPRAGWAPASGSAPRSWRSSPTSDGVCGVRTADDIISTRSVVIAAGVRSGELTAPVGFEIPVQGVARTIFYSHEDAGVLPWRPSSWTSPRASTSTARERSRLRRPGERRQTSSSSPPPTGCPPSPTSRSSRPGGATTT